MANPHDRFFKAIFSRPETAAEHFERFLPAPVVEALDLATLRTESGTFVDQALSERHSDLLFGVSWRDRSGEDADAFVYVLFEHQSEAHPLMAFRMLRYMVRIWDRWLKEHPKATSLPAIVPMVLFQGPSGWTAATDISELVAVFVAGWRPCGRSWRPEPGVCARSRRYYTTWRRSCRTSSWRTSRPSWWRPWAKSEEVTS